MFAFNKPWMDAVGLISGMMPLVATAPNLVVNSELVRHRITGFTLFSFTPFGVPVLLLGILDMLFARRWLAANSRRDAGDAHSVSLLDWIKKYQHAEREFRVRVTPQSPFVGKTLGEIKLRDDSGINVVAVERKRGFSTEVFAPRAKTALQAEDILLVDVFAPKVDIHRASPQFALEELPLTGAYFSDRSEEIGMAEVMVAPDSSLVGKTVIEAGFRSRFRLTLVGLRRGQTAM